MARWGSVVTGVTAGLLSVWGIGPDNTHSQGETKMGKSYDEPSVTEALEQMIDEHGLGHVLAGLGLVCFEKADHLRVNWQDNQTARAWDHMGKRLDKTAREALEIL